MRLGAHGIAGFPILQNALLEDNERNALFKQGVLHW
jgi:hypothetical protein